ncbi:MAG TPA: hypothetical protein VGB68_13960, partial [Pyrinomonadaceae bacterium]
LPVENSGRIMEKGMILQIDRFYTVAHSAFFVQFYLYSRRNTVMKISARNLLKGKIKSMEDSEKGYPA